VNDSEAYVTCGVKGFGLIQPARYMVAPYLQSGALREVLTAWSPPPMPISVVYLHNRHLSPKVRVFVDWMAELFEGCPLLGKCNAATEIDRECRFGGHSKPNASGAEIEKESVVEGVF